MPPDDLLNALGTHFAANSGRYGLDAGTIRLERFFESAVDATRSFTARDRDHALHVKLWPTERQTARDRWLAVHDLLESRHNAPRIVDTVDLPEVAMTGLVFEHIEGVEPIGRSSTDRLLGIARRLHADEQLAAKLGLRKGTTTVGQYFGALHVRRLDIDISIIRDSAPPSIADDRLVAWMEGETRKLERTAGSSPAFDVQAQWPTHGDLYEGNTLQADSGDLYVFDWDDLARGDPAADYIIILEESAQRDPGFDWRAFGVEATDDGFAERMRFYALLYRMIDGLAEYLGLDATDPLLAPISREKHDAFEKGLVLYRERYG